jgi:hypothetical protein
MYILFAGDVDDSEGGAEHFIAKSDDVELLKRLATPTRTKNNSSALHPFLINDYAYHWAHIFDLSKAKIVAKTDREKSTIWHDVATGE